MCMWKGNDQLGPRRIGVEDSFSLRVLNAD